MDKGLSISRRFLRSVNLARDSVSVKGIDGYIVTASARQALARIGVGCQARGLIAHSHLRDLTDRVNRLSRFSFFTCF